MYYKRKKPKSNARKYLLYILIIAVTGAVLFLGERTLRREIEATQAQAEMHAQIKTEPQDKSNSNYSANEGFSQENTPEPTRVSGGNNSSSPSNSSSASSNTDDDIIITKTPPKAFPTPTPTAEKFIVTVYDGKISVFKDGENVPEIVLDFPVSTLPEEDYDLLIAGIPANSLRHARQILEDYR